jgi:hypothetical protein
MTIDPRVGFYLSVVLAVIGVLAISGTTLTDMFGPHVTKIILSSSTLLLAIGNAVNAVLHAIPSKTTPAALEEFYLGPKKTGG